MVLLKLFFILYGFHGVPLSSDVARHFFLYGDKDFRQIASSNNFFSASGSRNRVCVCVCWGEGFDFTLQAFVSFTSDLCAVLGRGYWGEEPPPHWKILRKLSACMQKGATYFNILRYYMHDTIYFV